MKHKKRNTIILSGVLLIATICTLITVIVFKHNKKEIAAAEQFVDRLYQNNMIEIDDYDKIKYTSTKQADGLNSKGFYYITTSNFDIYVNDDYTVKGFTNRIEKVGVTEVSFEKAKEIAEKYLDIIVEDEVAFKSYEKEDSNVNYYSFVFKKYKEGYPFYTDEIIINIDKSKGLLDGYSNYSSQGEPSPVEIVAEQNDAEQTAIDKFLELNKEAGLLEITSKAYVTSKDGTECELCYIITIGGKDLDNKETKHKYFVSTKTGEIINEAKDNVNITTS